MGPKLIFCPTHSRQCYAMYRGYKRRNAKLDSMSQPDYLSQSTVPLGENNFEDLFKVPTIKEVRKHLHTQFALLDRVITARETHGKHFYPEDLDYGHKVWIRKLVAKRNTVEKALVRLARRYQEVLFQDERWFQWVKERQLEEEEAETKLKKNIKLEAVMFRRHARNVAERRAGRSEREIEAMQARDIEEVFQERMRLAEMADDELDEWDPIEDLVEDGRSRYIDLIMHFLWLDEQAKAEESTPPIDDFAEAARAMVEKSKASGKKVQRRKSRGKARGKRKEKRKEKSKEKPKQAKGEAQARGTNKPEPGSALMPSVNGFELDKSNIETRAAMRDRLRRGVEKNYAYGPRAVGSFQTPLQLADKTAPLPEDEIKLLMADIAQIKLLLFRRLLLSHATLLPIATQVQSVADFLSHPDLQESDLRELCIRLENPSLQDVRDACADLSRDTSGVEDEATHGEVVSSVQDDAAPVTSDMKDIPESRLGLVDFGRINRGRVASERMKVQICGKTIWNYASENAMSRDGWLQFSIIAKDCSLEEAIHLCRHWEELSDLSDLAQYNYFPAAKWAAWGGHYFHKQLNEKGFILYRDGFDWGNGQMRTLGNRSSRAWRYDNFLEQRAYVCGQMNRNSPVTRRFIQYCVMNTGDYLTFVRDAKTGRIITSPPERERWIERRKTGLTGRSRLVTKHVGPEFLKEAHAKAKWHTSFHDYYDIVIWDLLPNRESVAMYNLICQTLHKALRIKAASDLYNHQEPFLRTLTRDRTTMRARRIRPDEKVRSLWDGRLSNPNLHYYATTISDTGHVLDDTSPRSFYNESDMLEDAVLFPDDALDTRNVKLLAQMADPKGALAREVLEPMMKAMLHADGLLPSGVSPMANAPQGSYQEQTEGFFKSVNATPRLLQDARSRMSTTMVMPGLESVLKRTELLTWDISLGSTSMGPEQLCEYENNTLARMAGFGGFSLSLGRVI